jgi:hypothetical protein
MVSDLPLPWVCQMMPPSRRRTNSCAAFHSEVLVLAAQFLGPRVEHHEVVDQFEESRLAAHLQQVAVQPVRLAGVRAAFLHPSQVILLRRLDGGVAQPLAVVAGHQPLHRGKEGLDELLLLVVEVLTNALGHRHGGALQFQYAERDAVHVQHHIRALGAGLGIGPLDRHLLGNGEVVVCRMLPVDEPDGDGILPRLRPHLHAVAQHVVHGAVAVVEALAGIAGRFLQRMQGAVDEGRAHALLLYPARKGLRLDVAIALVLEARTVDPVTEIVVP